MPARLNFKEIAENNDIYEVAKYLGLTVTKDRATCPACDSERALQLYAETNSFYCHSMEKGGDCISLVAHVKGYSGQYPAAKELADRSGTATAARTDTATTPQKPGGEKQLPPTSSKLGQSGRVHQQPVQKSAKVDRPFDPVKFEASLAYTENVAAMGITEADATLMGIGEKRGKIYVPVRWPSGSIAGWQYTDEKGVVHFPKTWLADEVAANVIPLRRA